MICAWRARPRTTLSRGTEHRALCGNAIIPSVWVWLCAPHTLFTRHTRRRDPRHVHTSPGFFDTPLLRIYATLDSLACPLQPSATQHRATSRLDGFTRSATPSPCASARSSTIVQCACRWAVLSTDGAPETAPPARDARRAPEPAPPPAARRSDELDVLTHQPAHLAHLSGRSGPRAGLPATEPG